MTELDELRKRLEGILRPGLAEDAREHAEQVAQIAAVLYEAFKSVGLTCTLVGGSAIEVHAPGVYKSGDIDVVIEPFWKAGLLESIARVFQGLGFAQAGRHWTQGDVLVEVPSHTLDGPGEEVRIGGYALRIVKKEKLLSQRIVGFKHWGYTAYGQQAIDMLAAFGEELDLGWLREELEKEASYDAYLELRRLAQSDEPVNVVVLEELKSRLRAS